MSVDEDDFEKLKRRARDLERRVATLEGSASGQRQMLDRNRADLLQEVEHHRSALVRALDGHRVSTVQSLAELDERASVLADRLGREERDRAAITERHDSELIDLRHRHDDLLRRMRAGAGEEVTAVDARDVELDRLAAAAVAGAEQRSGWLTDGERVELTERIEAWPALHDRRRRYRAGAVRFSAAIASTAVADPTHREAAEKFRTAIAALAEMDARLEQTKADAETAAARRDADTIRRARDQEVVDTGDKAASELLERLRLRIDAAVAQGAFMPYWFERALGMGPSTRPERWIEVAAAVVAYRILYGVDSQTLPLGPVPGSDCPLHRREAHAVLEAELRTIR